jgi:hypothetical protein
VQWEDGQQAHALVEGKEQRDGGREEGVTCCFGMFAKSGNPSNSNHMSHILLLLCLDVYNSPVETSIRHHVVSLSLDRSAVIS